MQLSAIHPFALPAEIKAECCVPEIVKAEFRGDTGLHKLNRFGIAVVVMRISKQVIYERKTVIALKPRQCDVSPA